MTDYATHHPRAARRQRGTSAGLAFALTALVALIVAAAAFVALVMWPRWPTVAPGAPALPITVGGVLFNVPPAAFRVAAQRQPGAQERLDLAFLWPSLNPPEQEQKPALGEEAPPIDRLFVTIAAQSIAMSPTDRVRSIYPRYLAEMQHDGPDGLKMMSFKDGTPYQGDDLFFDQSAGKLGFVVRCSRATPAGAPGMCLYDRRIDGADVTVRFPSEWLKQWRTLEAGIATLIGKLKPGS